MKRIVIYVNEDSAFETIREEVGGALEDLRDAGSLKSTDYDIEEEGPQQKIVMAGEMLAFEDSTGEHDVLGAEPHPHWYVLIVEDAVVVDFDWGYHSADEAKQWLDTINAA